MKRKLLLIAVFLASAVVTKVIIQEIGIKYYHKNMNQFNKEHEGELNYGGWLTIDLI